MLDFDQLGAMHKLAKGVDLSENGQGMEAFHQVEPGGHFLGCAHTQANFETAFYRSNIADNNSVEQWMEEGSKDAAQRANAIWKKMLAEYDAAADRSRNRRGACAISSSEERRRCRTRTTDCGSLPHHAFNGARGRHRRRRRRRLDALSSGQERLERQRAGRAQGADVGLDLARRRAAAAVQHVLFGRPVAQIFGRALRPAAERDRPRRRFPPSLQHPSRAHARTGSTNTNITPASRRPSAASR